MTWKEMPHGVERYHAYLASRKWALLKRAAHQRALGICEECHLHDATETHHWTYARLYNERPDDLKAVCHECHLYLSGIGEETWRAAIMREPQPVECVKCGGNTGDAIGRNEKGQWLCDPCAASADDRRRMAV